MKGQLPVATPQEYLSKLAEPRRSEIAALDALIRENAPQLEPYIQSGVLAYGKYQYNYPSGRSGEWPKIGLASNANYISLYTMAADAQGYVAERYKPRLPKASIGKACVRFKRVSDLDLSVLAELIQQTAQMGYDYDHRASSQRRKPAAKKAAVAKPVAKKTATKSAAARKAAAKKPAPKKPGVKAPARKAPPPAKRSPAKKAPAPKGPAMKVSSKRR